MDFAGFLSKAGHWVAGSLTKAGDWIAGTLSKAGHWILLGSCLRLVIGLLGP